MKYDNAGVVCWATGAAAAVTLDLFVMQPAIALARHWHDIRIARLARVRLKGGTRNLLAFKPVVRSTPQMWQPKNSQA